MIDFNDEAAKMVWFVTGLATPLIPLIKFYDILTNIE